DPPREGVREALEEARKLGIDIKMITGDHPLTAKAIAKELGFEGDVVTLEDLEMKIGEIEKISVFARVMPEDKYRIVEILQKRGYLVAMTGDGVNDVPALKKANVGIALGAGSDIAKEAADFVLLDDNLSTIVESIKEGRSILKNISASIRYLLSMNFSEIALIALGTLKRIILLEPLQILWMNLVTDSLPAIGFAYESYEDVEKRREIVKGGEWKKLIGSSILLAFVSFLAFNFLGKEAALNTLIYTELFYPIILRKKLKAKENKVILWFIFLSLLAQLLGTTLLGNLIGLTFPEKELLLVFLSLPALYFIS
ncbi:hypothetical protein DRJ19_06010, partial [Candidatus Woesearchaeota archaeon]